MELFKAMTGFVDVNLETVVPYFSRYIARKGYNNVSRQKVMNLYLNKLLEVLFVHSTRLKLWN